MKKLFTLSVVILITLSVLAQAPQKMSYQAVIRNSSKALVTSSPVGMRVSILQGTTLVYVETHATNTNANGLVTIEIGGGTYVSGVAFSAIDWSAGTYSIKTETDPTGGTDYTAIVGTSQLLSVPYALYSKTAQTADYNNLTNLPNLSGYLTSESDPVFVLSPAHGITNGNITNWNTAFGWGNHAGLYRPIGYVPAWSEITSKPTTISGYGITDAVATTGNQTITGIKSFSSDLLINGLTVGRGQGAVFTNTANGMYALYSNTTGINNTATGYSALILNSTGTNNTANGYGALNSNTTGLNNTANGFEALYSNTTGHSNTANGSWALWWNSTGSSNTAYGDSALFSNTTASSNSANGYQALALNTTGAGNTAIGEHALFLNTAGENNTANGYNAGYSNIGNNNVFLGSSAGYYETGSNKLFIDNQKRADESDARNKALIYGIFDANPSNQVLTINGNVGIGTTTPGSKLEVTGQIKITGGTPAMGKVLTSDATGLATWQTPSGGGHYIGESYGGGIVFYVYDNGQHGLIAATADQSTGIRWYAGTYTTTMALADGVGAGKANTAIIIANQGYGDGATYAARICNEYQVTVGGVTYGDWYLPSKFELNLLYLQRTVVGGFASNNYWSSTESNNNTVWNQFFYDGSQNANLGKINPAPVRAVRAF